ncbi:MAG: polysulfide reductase NrfD, partial [Acidobacteria bacterium]|nr:polysulfide reductase NrfD [Acidobacteriota bacterium]
TGPKIFYLQAHESIIQPEVATRPFIFKEGNVHLRPLGALEPDPLHPGDARVDYDAPHKKAWGMDLVLYLLAKGISTGALFLGALFWLMGDHSALTGLAAPLVATVFAIMTAAVLVWDLERPERFYYILTRPNWTSWMARGAFILTAHGAVAGLWIFAWLLDWPIVITVFAVLALPVALAATAYTGLLFAQGLARDLWQGWHHTVDLVAQAAAEGSAALLLVALFVDAPASTLQGLGWTLAGATVVHLLILVAENLVLRSHSRHHALAVRAIRSGAYSKLFWVGALGLGGVAPLLLFWLAAVTGFSMAVLVPMAVVTLAGSLAWEYIWVEAGQCVPIS